MIAILLFILVIFLNVSLSVFYGTYLVLINVSKYRLHANIVLLFSLIIYGFIYIKVADLSNFIAYFKHIFLLYKQEEFAACFRYQLKQFRFLLHNGYFIFLLLPNIIYILADCIDLLILKKNISKSKNVSTEKVHIDGVFLGFRGETPIILSDKEINQHCLIMGTTGAGKTTTIMNFVEGAARRNIPVIYLDGKGSTELVDKLQQVAKYYNRKLKVFSLNPSKIKENLAGYNPFCSGNATEWKNRIMSLFVQASSRGQEHFSLGEQNYINFVANVVSKLEKQVDLRVILGFLEQPEKILALANKIDPIIAGKLAKLHSEKDVTALVNDIVKLLELFIYSDYGYLFNTNDLPDVINIKQSILDGDIVLFLFDASAYREDTQKIAKMVINDINSCFSDFDDFTPTYCIFDEFASYANEELSNSISLKRSKGMHAIIGTQSIATVKLKSEETKRVAEELMACCNTYIVHTINHADDAEIMAKIMGTRISSEVTAQIGNEGITGVGSLKTVDKFKVHPQTLKELKTGEVVVYRKVNQQQPIQFNIYKIY